MVIFSPRGLVQRPAALGARRQQIAQADIREGAAHHHFMIAAARAVGIEIHGLDAVGDQIFARRPVGLNRASGRNVIGGDAVRRAPPERARREYR